jgi:hypothetical protein
MDFKKLSLNIAFLENGKNGRNPTIRAFDHIVSLINKRFVLVSQ